MMGGTDVMSVGIEIFLRADNCCIQNKVKYPFYLSKKIKNKIVKVKGILSCSILGNLL